MLFYSMFSKLSTEHILTLFLTHRSLKEGKLNHSSVLCVAMLFVELSFRCRESSVSTQNLCLAGSNFCSPKVKKINITSCFSVGVQLNLGSNYLKQFYHMKSIHLWGWATEVILNEN